MKGLHYCKECDDWVPVEFIPPNGSWKCEEFGHETTWEEMPK